MSILTLALTLLVFGVVILAQSCRALGIRWGTAVGALLILGLGGAWGMLQWGLGDPGEAPADLADSKPITSDACIKCHADHYRSWERTYHRTMTREATPQNVRADFNDVVHRVQGVTSFMSRVGDAFFIETVDAGWETWRVKEGLTREQAGPPDRRRYSVDRLVGSHWFQQMLTKDELGRYYRLPLAYHLVEKRWIHIDGAFVAPESRGFWGKAYTWNETCLYCHNTRPSKNPEPISGQPPGYRTEVGELGIACEACHGAADRHVRLHQNPARRFAQHDSEGADPTIANPAKLSVARADEICARCHARTIRRVSAWNAKTHADPYRPGEELARVFFVCFSEAEMRERQKRQEQAVAPVHPDALDGHFWGDGTPMTTALEYPGIALSACYQGGHGKMSCLTCHSMHRADPNHQVKEGMRTNESCYGCHAEYRAKLASHTHHPQGSTGSLCANCHMPYQVYSLLDTHRSHRIGIPRVADSVGTGKPHACNLCHLDKSLGWTQDQLAGWYGTKTMVLSEEDRNHASSVLHLTKSDARSRAVVAGAFGWSPAQQASGGMDWSTPLLLRALEEERYDAVRYTLYKALRSLHGPAVDGYDYQGTAADRAAAVKQMRLALEKLPRPDRTRYPQLPLEGTIETLLRARSDPDVSVNE